MAFDALIIQALSLSERKRYVAKVPLQASFSDQIDSWKQWFDRNAEPTRWLQFLNEAGLRETDLLELAHATTLRSSSLPPWTVTLQNLMNNLRSGISRRKGKCSLTRNLTDPVVRFAWRELSDNLSASRMRLLSPAAQSALRKSLTTKLERTVRQVAEWECHLFGERCLEEGSEAQLFRLLQQYPALARLWSQLVRNWIDFVADFLDHARDFLRASTKDDAIRSIVPDMSDAHSGNRTVLRVRFRRAGLWYYKPRRGEAEQGWSALLGWFNKSGFRPTFKTLNVISQEDHTWMKPIPVRCCRTRKEARVFFFRSGALLCLIDLLRGCDFHAGNLVAHGIQPVVIDCETLRHPATPLPASRRLRERDVLRTGLLPTSGIGNESLDDGSGLGCETSAPHQLRCAGRPAFARNFVEDLVSGFTVMHGFIRHRESEFRAVAEKSLPRHVRCLYRPTIFYEVILESSLAPRILVNGLMRTLFLEASFRSGSLKPRHVEQEVAAVENADIPYFVGRACAIGRIRSKTALAESVALIQRSLRKNGRPR